MLNTRSDYLVILVATYNRIALLKRTLDSIAAQTKCSHEVIVIDGGSTDGTIEYLQAHSGITPVYQGELSGTARCYNQVWRQIASKYTCWLSDDTEVINNSLDLAVNILEKNPEIGMVGLKMKDTIVPPNRTPRLYMGKISKYGILNCNHGVLPTELLKSVDFFNEDYHSYPIDPDLTASVLSAGKNVVMTKCISILHHREWSLSESWQRATAHADKNLPIYLKKFNYLFSSVTGLSRIKQRIWINIVRVLFLGAEMEERRFGLNRRDWLNIIRGRFIRNTDPLDSRSHSYHLVQKIPEKFLAMKSNPYRHLVKS